MSRRKFYSDLMFVQIRVQVCSDGAHWLFLTTCSTARKESMGVTETVLPAVVFAAAKRLWKKKKLPVIHSKRIPSKPIHMVGEFDEVLGVRSKYPVAALPVPASMPAPGATVASL